MLKESNVLICRSSEISKGTPKSTKCSKCSALLDSIQHIHLLPSSLLSVDAQLVLPKRPLPLLLDKQLSLRTLTVPVALHRLLSPSRKCMLKMSQTG